MSVNPNRSEGRDVWTVLDDIIGYSLRPSRRDKKTELIERAQGRRSHAGDSPDTDEEFADQRKNTFALWAFQERNF